MRLFYRKKMLENRHFLIGIFQHFTTVADTSSSALNKKLRQSLKDLGINRSGFHFHSLRHTHVAHLLACGIDIYIISKRLGHTNISTTTRTYSYLIDEYKAKNDEQIRNELDKLSLQEKVNQVSKGNR